MNDDLESRCLLISGMSIGVILTMILVMLCGCQSIRDHQNAKWNQEYSWINWPTNQ